MTRVPSHRPTARPAHHAVPKSDGDGAAQAWIALLPGWQAERAAQIDAVVQGACPQLRRAVKWHGLWYGQAGSGWFLALNTFKTYIKLTFFDGCHLVPVPPDALAQKPASALNLKEAAPLDAALIADWVAQAWLLPGLFKV